MTTEKRYLQREDVSRRLHDSIVRYKGVFYYATLADGDSLNIDIHSLDSYTKVGRVDANTPDLDISSPELGYSHCVSSDCAVFIRRAPYRRQKQGIGTDNLTYTSHVNGKQRLLRGSEMITTAFKSMLEGKYRTYQQTLEYFNNPNNAEKKSCIAFSRDLALGVEKLGALSLYYQNTKIGEVQKVSDMYGRTQLTPQYNNSVFIQLLSKHGALNA